MKNYLNHHENLQNYTIFPTAQKLHSRKYWYDDFINSFKEIGERDIKFPFFYLQQRKVHISKRNSPSLEYFILIQRLR